MTPKKDPIALLKQISSFESCPAVVAIVVPDQVRRERALASLLEKIGVPNQQVRTFDSEGFTPQTLNRLRDELFSVSIFSPRTTVQLKKFDALTAEQAKKIISALKSIPSSAKLLITGGAVTASHPFTKWQGLCLIEIPELKGYELTRWVTRELRSLGVNDAEEEAIQSLTDIGEGAPDKILPLVQQLSLYLDGQKLTQAALFNIFVEHQNPNEFELIELLARRERARSEILISRLLRSGKNHFMLLSLLQRTLSNLLIIRSLLDQGLDSATIRQATKLPPWLFSKQLGQAKNFSTKQLRRALVAVLSADSKFKNRSLGPELVLSELLSRVTV